MIWRVGMECVCVNAAGEITLATIPVEGRVYTIREIVTDNVPHPCFLLVEIVNRPGKYRTYSGKFVRMEKCFGAHRFRPLVETKTDISIFEKLLSPSRVSEPV